MTSASTKVFRMIHPWRRPKPAEITFAGENTYQIRMRMKISEKGVHVVGIYLNLPGQSRGVHSLRPRPESESLRDSRSQSGGV
jgi:hypothetical protein